MRACNTAHEASFMLYDTLVPGHEYTVLSLPPISAWALLFAGKDVESRPWNTTQRGRVLIHAASERPNLRESQARRAEVSFLSGIAPSALPAILPRHAILGSVEIIDCTDDSRSKWAVPGRQHWIFRDPRPLRVPVDEVGGEPEFWRWTYARRSSLSTERRRAPLQSGIVPAVRVTNAELARAAAQPAATRKRA
jgi:hypothetical protein